MSSLQGYVVATYDEIVEQLGEPSYLLGRTKTDGAQPTADVIETEWDLHDNDGNIIRVYDWKCFDCGATSRSGNKYKWHISGQNHKAVDVIENFGFSDTDYV